MSKNIIYILILILSPILFIHYGIVENHIIAENNEVSVVVEDLKILDSNNMTYENNSYFCDVLGGEITIFMNNYLNFSILSIKDIQLNNENDMKIPLKANILYDVKYFDNVLTINDIQYNYNFAKLKIVFKNYGVIGEVEQQIYTTFHNENFRISSDINVIKGNISNDNGIKYLIPNILTAHENTVANFIAITNNSRLFLITLNNLYQKDITIDINDNMISINGDYDLIEAFNPIGEIIEVNENNIFFEVDGVHKIRLTINYCITNLFTNVTIPITINPEEPDVIVPPNEPDEIEKPNIDNLSEDGLGNYMHIIIHIYVFLIFIIILVSFIITIVFIPWTLISGKKINENRKIIEIKSMFKENNQISSRFIKHNKARSYLLGLVFIASIILEIILPILFPLITILWAYHSSSIIEQMSGRNSKTKNILHNKKLLLSSIVYKTMLIAGTLFFIVPGILIRINFGMYSNIIIDDDNSNETIISIFAKSINLMRGYRIAYFKLLCKQIFYVIISILSFGILLPWTLHYIISQKSLFYLSIYN